MGAFLFFGSIEILSLYTQGLRACPSAPGVIFVICFFVKNIMRSSEHKIDSMISKKKNREKYDKTSQKSDTLLIKQSNDSCGVYT